MEDQQNTPWQYKPSGETTGKGLLPNDQPQITQSPSTQAKVVAWQAPEFIEHDRNAGWYSGFFLGAIVLTGAIYLITKELFAAGTIVVLAILALILYGRKPRVINYEATSDGLKVDGKLYEYNNFKSFSIMQEGNVSSISLLPLKRFMPPIAAIINDKDRDAAAEVIGDQLPYEERKADAVDRISQRLRF